MAPLTQGFVLYARLSGDTVPAGTSSPPRRRRSCGSSRGSGSARSRPADGGLRRGRSRTEKKNGAQSLLKAPTDV